MDVSFQNFRPIFCEVFHSRSSLFLVPCSETTRKRFLRRLVEEHFCFFFFCRAVFFFLTLSDIFKICIIFVCTPHVNFMNNLIYCNNSMFCIACEIKICSHMDYQKAFLRLTAIPAVGIAVIRK